MIWCTLTITLSSDVEHLEILGCLVRIPIPMTKFHVPREAFNLIKHYKSVLKSRLFIIICLCRCCLKLKISKTFEFHNFSRSIWNFEYPTQCQWHPMSHFLVLLHAFSSSRLTSVNWCFLLSARQPGKDPLLFFQFEFCHCLLAHCETDKTNTSHTHTLGPRVTQSCSLHSADELDDPD